MITKLFRCFLSAVFIFFQAGICSAATQAPPSPDWSVYLFYNGDQTGARYFRIPALTAMSNGDVLAAIDGRISGNGDSPNNIDTKIKSILAGTQTVRTLTAPYTFLDHPGGTSLQEQSASFIDPCLVEDTERHRVWLMIDIFPWNGGLANGNVVAGSGMKTINGKQYLALTDNAASAENDRDFSKFKYTIREDGIIWNDNTNTPTDYKVNSYFELSQKVGNVYQPLFVKQLVNDNTSVPMNIFYQRSLFRVLRTSYLFLFYSDDYGANWSTPINLNYLKKDTETSFICGTGKGLQLKTGRYQGRMMFPVYHSGSASVVYTDDGGDTWKRSAQVGVGTGVASPTESELVEMPEGHVAMFSRTGGGYISLTYSYTGGASWLTSQYTPLVHSGCKISALRYSKLVDGQPAILVSYPNSATKRENGCVATGLISITGRFGNNNPNYAIEWKEPIVLRTGTWGYSCMVELPNSKIGIFTETGTGIVEYLEYSPEKLIPGTLTTDTSIDNLENSPIKLNFQQDKNGILFENALASIELYNLCGNLIQKVENTKSLNTRQVQQGIYIMQAKDNYGNSGTWKIVL